LQYALTAGFPEATALPRTSPSDPHDNRGATASMSSGPAADGARARGAAG